MCYSSQNTQVPSIINKMKGTNANLSNDFAGIFSDVKFANPYIC